MKAMPLKDSDDLIEAMEVYNKYDDKQRLTDNERSFLHSRVLRYSTATHPITLQEVERLANKFPNYAERLRSTYQFYLNTYINPARGFAEEIKEDIPLPRTLDVDIE